MKQAHIDPDPTTIGIVSRRLLPFLMLLYLIAYIDRANISVAALQMNADLGLTAKMYGIGAGLFFVTYILFEVPSNLMLERFGARRWISRIMVSWGLVACGMAFIQTPAHLYSARLLLGAAEAGFTPGIIFYLTSWFPRRSRARAMSFFYIAATMASVIGMPLSGALLRMDGLFGYSGWRWLYFIEGLPAIIFGIVVLRILPDTPNDAKWLAPEQRAWLISRIKFERERQDGAQSHAWHRSLSDGRVWLLSLFWLSQAFGTIGITLFIPQIVKALSGAGDFRVSLYSAFPYVLASLVMYFNGRNSDQSGERQFHLTIPMISSSLLLLAGLHVGGVVSSYILIAVAVALNWAATPIFWSVTTEYLAGSRAAAASIALINAIANIAGSLLPPLIGYLKDRTGSYNGGLTIVATALLLGGLLAYQLVPRLRAIA